MKLPRPGPLALLAALLAWAASGSATPLPAPATGASVEEGRVRKALLVDPASPDAADDARHGSADAPFATLRYACEAAVKLKEGGTGVKVLLAAGTYREAVDIRPPAGGGLDTDAPLVIEAAERDQAAIDGADTEGWTPSTWKIEAGRWTHPWPFTRAGVPRPAPGLPPSATGAAYRRGDLLFINGVPLRQVGDLKELAPGTFFGQAGRAGPGGKKGAAAGGAGVVVQPPEDTNLAGIIVQAGARARGLTITGRRNVAVRGVMCQHAAAPAGGGGAEDAAGLVLKNCTNVLVEDVLCQWNDGAGLLIQGGADVTLRRVRLLHNGGSGLAAAGVKNLLAEDCEASFNNFRGEWAGWVDPAGPAGIKVEGVHGSAWRRTQVVGNACRGLSLAGDDPDATVEEAVLRNNLLSGLDVENNPGPTLARRCLVTGTKSHPGARDELALPAGILLSAARDVTLESCVAAGNAGAQLALWDVGKPPLRAERHTYRHNVFAGNDAAQAVCALPGKPDDAAAYCGTLASDENCFWNPALAEAFVFYNRSDRGGIHRPGAGVDLAGWRTLLAGRGAASTEANSLWQNPRFAAPAEGDYRFKATGPMAEWDLPVEEASGGQ